MSAVEIVPVLGVGEWAEAERFYVGVLGFTEPWTFGDPPQYGGVCAGGPGSPSLHLSVCAPGTTPSPSEVYVTVASVDEVGAIHQRCREAGAEVVFEPGDREYQMHDFMVKDSWGNRLSFGADIS